MPTPEQVLAGYQRTVANIRSTVVARGLRLWENLPDYRDSDIDRFVAQIVPVVQAGKLRTATVTAAYVRQAAKADGDDVPMVFAGREAILTSRKIDPVVEYRRPAVTLYTALSDGQSFTDAVVAGAVRLTDLLVTDLQLAKTTQSRASMQGAGYSYYRRVLTGSENCALCSIASTQRYHVADLMPIHPGCDCGTAKVDADFDPGQVIDPQFLEETHGHVKEFIGIADAGGRAPDYRKLLITRENGEWGPTLTWLSDKFTGPDQLAA